MTRRGGVASADTSGDELLAGGAAAEVSKIAGCSASVAGIQIPQWGPDIARNVSMEAQVAKQGVRRMFMRMQGRK